MPWGWITHVGWVVVLAGLAACGARTELLACMSATANDQCATSNGAAGAPIGVTGGGVQSNGGSAGAGLNNGGTGNVEAGGSSGSSGSSGFPGAGESGVAGAPATVAPHWIALSVSHGACAYDVSRYPSKLGLSQLSSAPPDMSDNAPAVGPWSPDGKKLLYRDGKDWFVRDMTTNPPGPALVVARAPVPPDYQFAQFGWSADSQTITWVTGRQLMIVDPTLPQPSYTALTQDLVPSNEWAPAGNHLLYTEASSAHVVAVNAGKAGTPQLLDPGMLRAWSPDGKYLASITPDASGSVNGDLTLTDVTGSTLTSTVVTKPTILQPTVTEVWFSPDSSFLVFAGAQVRPWIDVFYVPLKPSIGAPVLVSNALANIMVNVADVLFLSPDGHWIGYSGSSAEGPELDFAAEMSGGVPVAQFPLQLEDDFSYSWLPKKPQELLAFGANNDDELFNLPASNPTFVPVDSESQSLSPVADVLLWTSNPGQISLRDLDTLAPPTIIDAKLENSELLWSPDGEFISLLDAEAGGDAIELIRVAGAVPSPRVAIAAPASPDSSSLWPPVFP